VLRYGRRPDGRTNGDDTVDHTVPESVAFQIMQDQVAFLRTELERKDAILLTMAKHLPELEATPEPRERTETSSENSGNGGEPPKRRSWWRRLVEG
jgi:hypothetical protein